jgi:hypothetical protein
MFLQFFDFLNLIHSFNLPIHKDPSKNLINNKMPESLAKYPALAIGLTPEEIIELTLEQKEANPSHY